MARIRSVHPGLWTDERFVSVSPLARLLFIGLWNECDDQGSFAWSPLALRMRLLPGDNTDPGALLDELIAAGCIMRYELDARIYGAVRNFARFQRPKKPNSIHPQPPEVRNWCGNLSADGGGRMEEEGGRRGESRASAIPADFVPILTDAAKATVKVWPSGMLERELAKFVDHHRAKGSTFKDWQAAFRTWIANADEWRGRNGTARNGVGAGGRAEHGFTTALREAEANRWGSHDDR